MRRLALCVILGGCSASFDVRPLRYPDLTVGPQESESAGACFPIATSDSALGTVVLGPVTGAPPAIGTPMLLLQVQEDVALASTLDTSGNTTAASAGTWQILTLIDETDGGSVTLSFAGPLVTGYSSGLSGSRAQVCSIPHYNDVTISSGGQLVAESWNGETGGVVALAVAGELLLDGAISASGRGFRGGAPSDIIAGFGNAPNAPVLDCDDGGRKGEGIGGRWEDLEADLGSQCGQGSFAGGGGGGNRFNAGGGGGANAGRGGHGAGNHGPVGGQLYTKGLGGGQIELTRGIGPLLMGGGGGGGHQNYTTMATGGSGGNGGGVVLLLLLDGARVTGTGTIESRGAVGMCSPDDGNADNGCIPDYVLQADGAGGGGAGGTIHVEGQELVWEDGTLSASGGAGGAVKYDDVDYETPFGSGGGGGGGRIHIPSAGTATPSLRVDGGLGGEYQSPSTSVSGAGAGAPGQVEVEE